MSNNQEAAEMFIEAIKQIANKPDNLNNLESYLGQHFDIWLNKYAYTPEDIAAEMKMFAEMKICFVYQQLYIKKPVLMKGDLINEHSKRRFIPY
jgi:hypothetical protein